MYLDAQLYLSPAQTLTASGPSTNVFDGGGFQNRNLTDGEGLCLFYNLPTAPVGTGTYSINLQGADDAAFTVNLVNYPTVTLQSTDLVVGKKGIIGIPALTTFPRYMRVYYTLGGTSPSITINAAIEPIHMVDRFRTYKDNSPIQ
jgi:hypothetical protein